MDTDKAEHGVTGIIASKIARNFFKPTIIIVNDPEFENDPPNNLKIEGPNRGKPEREYVFKFSADDPDENQLYYMIDWGDNSEFDWIGPLNNREVLSISHFWSLTNTFTIRFKAKDIWDAESEWQTLEINIPKNNFNIFKFDIFNNNHNNPLLLFLKNLLSNIQKVN